MDQEQQPDDDSSPGEAPREQSDEESNISDNIAWKRDQNTSEKAKRPNKYSEENNTVLKLNQLCFLRDYEDLTNTNRLTNAPTSSSPTKQLRAIGLQEVSVREDGNCFFRAISYGIHQRQDNHLNIRASAIEYLESNKQDFALFMDKSIYPTAESYIKQMRRNGFYADHPVVLATAIIIQKNIIVHERGKKPLRIPGSDCFENQLHVRYIPEKEHYNSVVPTDNKTVVLSCEQILET